MAPPHDSATWVRASTALPDEGRDMIVSSSRMIIRFRGQWARVEDLVDAGGGVGELVGQVVGENADPAGLPQRVDAFDPYGVGAFGDVGGDDPVDTAPQEPLVAQRGVVDTDADPDAEVLGAERFPQPGPDLVDAGPGRACVAVSGNRLSARQFRWTPIRPPIWHARGRPRCRAEHRCGRCAGRRRRVSAFDPPPGRFREHAVGGADVDLP